MEYFLAILGSLATVLVTQLLNRGQSNEVKEEARLADQRQLANQKELMRYQTELQSDTNTIATQKGHAAAAGVNPSLLFDSLPSLADVSGGNAQGTLPQFPQFSKATERIHPTDLSSLAMQNKQQQLLARQVSSQEDLNTANKLYYFARTAEEMRNTKFKKRMEGVVYDQAMADLHLTKSKYRDLDFQTIRASLLLPGELKNQGLINDSIAKQMDKIDDDMKTSAVMRAKYRAETASIQEEMKYISKKTEFTEQELKESQERLRGTVIERVMKQFGLNHRSLPAWMRKDKIENYYLRQPQLLGAVGALVQQGMSVEEATACCLWYQASDPKDATPSIVNAVSRGISALILKK